LQAFWFIGVVMSIWLSVLLFVVGILFVVKGGDWFVDAASWIAKAARIPSFIIGATVVSFATTLPEMIVSVIASMENKTDMAVGNAIGSVTANTGLIMAIAFIFMHVIIDRKKYIKQSFLLIGTIAILLLGSLTGQLQIWASIILVGIFFLFMYFNVTDAKKDRLATADVEASVEVNGKIIFKNIVLFIVGAACIVLGSNLLIKGGSAIATFFGVPERVIAITMVAIGTSLPELVTTITAIIKKESNISIGNIIGANIIDVSLILPVCSAVSRSKFPISTQGIMYDIPVCLLITLLALIPLLIRKKGSKIQGIVMVLVYIAYLVFTL
jgi:cation:H+ antiporter